MISPEHSTTAVAPGGIGRVSGSEKMLLRLEGVSKRWPKSDRALLDGVDLDLPAGTFAVIAGKNGTGKTTLLRIAAGIIDPSGGTVQLDGLSARRSRREYHRRIGLLSAGSVGLYARLTVVQHLAYWAGLAFVPRRERSARISEAVARFELEAIAERRTDRLSMGQRQRLRLALALLHRPSLLLLDEPWNSLDEKGIELTNATVREFAAGGGSTLVCVPTGHDIDIDVAADRLFVLENGRLEVR